MSTTTVSLEGGVSITMKVLQDHTNFLSWRRDLRRIASLQGVWREIIGAELDLPEPLNKCTGAMQPTLKHQRDLEEYQHQQKGMRVALNLLAASVHPSIRDELSDFKCPSTAYDFLLRKYRDDNARLLAAAYHNLNQISLTPDMSLNDYIHELRQCQIDIHEAGGEFGDNLLQIKMSMGLPKEYSDAVNGNMFEARDWELDEFILHLKTIKRQIEVQATSRRWSDQCKGKGNTRTKGIHGKCAVLDCQCWKAEFKFCPASTTDDEADSDSDEADSDQDDAGHGPEMGSIMSIFNSLTSSSSGQQAQRPTRPFVGGSSFVHDPAFRRQVAAMRASHGPTS